MSNIVLNNEKELYEKWINELGERFRKSQIKASVSVNKEMLRFYWDLGCDIHNLRMTSKWGSSFFVTLSNDLKKKLPGVKSFSVSNLRYMQRFYDLFHESKKIPQVGEELFCIPWGHMKLIIDKFDKHKEYDKAIFFVNKIIENNWSRAVLLNFLDTDLYERQGKAITNFQYQLPGLHSDLAQEITKDPYNFDFLTLTEDYDEKELKEALLANIQKFLLELGKGFAFVGKEYRLLIGNTEEFLDLLFYNIYLHCYVVVEVKISSFHPRDIGQLQTYVTAVNHILKQDNDEVTIGLLICKTKDNVLAKYAIEGSNQPIGISE